MHPPSPPLPSPLLGYVFQLKKITWESNWVTIKGKWFRLLRKALLSLILITDARNVMTKRCLGWTSALGGGGGKSLLSLLLVARRGVGPGRSGQFPSGWNALLVSLDTENQQVAAAAQEEEPGSGACKRLGTARAQPPDRTPPFWSAVLGAPAPAGRVRADRGMEARGGRFPAWLCHPSPRI